MRVHFCIEDFPIENSAAESVEEESKAPAFEIDDES